MRSWRCLGLLLAILFSLAPNHVRADANALWHIVGEQCVPDQKQNDSPRPCEQVDLAGGYAILKDVEGNTQFLLIPTTRVSGIESPAILVPGAPNYWQEAWQARYFVQARARHFLPRDAIGLAINSISGRTQNQLHIHIDCVRLDVTRALRGYAGAIGSQWGRFPVPLVGHDYLALRISQSDLSGNNPFLLLANGVQGARADMAHWTIVVVGDRYQGQAGFIVLAGRAAPGAGDWGVGEQLLDHACAAATVASE